jgi:RNA polymerase sigma-70 factor (ECF subfamily)
MGSEISGEPRRRTEVSDLQDRRDRELMGRIAQGSAEGFRDLYRRYASTANGLALRVIGDAALAEEVTQDVFLSVWRSAAAYDAARGSVRSWLLTQVHHRAVDIVRKEDAERRRSMREREPLPADPTDDVVEDAWLRARRNDIRAALGTISSEQRQVLDLAYFGGLTQTQIAERLGIPLGTVKSRTLTAMLKLREALSGAER